MYFKKIDIPFDTPKFQVGKLAMQYGLKIENKFHGIWYNNIKKEKDCPLKEIIPKEFQDAFVMQFMQVNSFIPPHTDSDTLAVINFYLETDDCITQFYDIKKDAKPFQLDNQTNGYLYDLNDLELGPSFNAKPGDIYILDVTKVHSVIPIDERKIKRKALCLASRFLDFNQVQELLFE